jgi:hypothetical protein
MSNLTHLLNMVCTRFRATETLVFGVTKQTWAATADVPIHVQPLSPDETARAYGYEAIGTRYQGFAEYDADFRDGDLVRLTSIEGSTAVTMVGYQFLVRGRPDDTVWPGIEHQLLDLEFRPEKST